MDELGRTWARITERCFGRRPGEAHGGLRVLLVDTTTEARAVERAVEPWLRGGAQLTIAATNGVERLRASPAGRRCHRVVALHRPTPGEQIPRGPGSSVVELGAASPWPATDYDVVVTLGESARCGSPSSDGASHDWYDAARRAVAFDGLWLDTTVCRSSDAPDWSAASGMGPARTNGPSDPAFEAFDEVRVAVDVTKDGAGEPHLTWCLVRASSRRARDSSARESDEVRPLTATVARSLPGSRTRCVEPRRIEVAMVSARRGDCVVAPPLSVVDDAARGDGGEDVPAVWSALRRVVAEVDSSAEHAALGDVDLRALPFGSGWVAAPMDSSVVADGDVDVLAIVAHPDDEVLELGGTLARLVDDGAKVHVVVATAGEGGRDARATSSSLEASSFVSGSELGHVRRREHEAALSVLLGPAVSVSTLELPDTGKYVDEARLRPMGSVEALRRWGVDAVVGRLVEVIRQKRPLLVLGHAASHDSTWSLHGHHLALGVATSVAIVAAADARVHRDDPRLPPWRTREHRVVIAAEIAESIASREVISVPIDPARKAAALEAHASQLLSLELPVARLRAAAPEALVEHFARGVELRSPRERAPRSWLASIATSRSSPSMRWERLLAGPPGVVETLWGTSTETLRPAPRAAATSRDALVIALGEGEVAASATPEERASRGAFADAATVAVVAGQQVGVFGGPAFTLGKAIDAWAHARASRAVGISAIPVFWMATFDHDLDEVAELYAGRRRDPARARLRHDGRGKIVGPQPLGGGIVDALALVERRLARTPHHAWAMSRLRALHSPTTSFRAAFAGLLRELTTVEDGGVDRGLGIVWLDPSTRAIAALGRDVLAAALFQSTRVREALDEGARLLRDFGLSPLIPRDRLANDGRVHTEVFVTDEAGVRSALWRERGGGWVTAHGRRYDKAELEALLHDAPERLTPSVLLRPLVQARVLPVATFVAGPTELRYLAQLGALHRALGLTAPRIVPRRRMTFIAREEVAALAAFGVSPELAVSAPGVVRDRVRYGGEPSPVVGLAEVGGGRIDPPSSLDGAIADLRAALTALRRLAIRAAEYRRSTKLTQESPDDASSELTRALAAACEGVSTRARSIGLHKSAARSTGLGIALSSGPPERSGARAIRGVWSILRAMRRELDRRDGETRAAVAALERLSPSHLTSLHAADRDLGVADLMANVGPSGAAVIAARRLAELTGVASDGAVLGGDPRRSRGDQDDTSGRTGSMLVVFDSPAPVLPGAAPLAVPHPWTDEASRRAVRTGLHALAKVTSPAHVTREAHADFATPGVSGRLPIEGERSRRRVAVLGMGGLGGSGKVAGEVAVIYAQAGHHVWHWTGEGSRWALEFDQRATGRDDAPPPNPANEGSVGASDPSEGAAARPMHEVMPVPETPSLRDDARFRADVDRLADAIARRVERAPLDVVHVHYADVLLDAVLQARARVSERSRFAVMVTLHGSDVTALASASPRARELSKMLEACDVVTTPSRFLAREAKLRLGIPTPVVVPNAIDAGEHDPDAGHVLRAHLQGTGAMVVAHASNLRPIKRPVDAARVVATLRARGLDARFVAAGEGPLQAALADEVTSNPNLGEAATLLGACSTATLREVFAAADILLVTSESESFSLVALEALAAGTLVVGTRCGGLEELLSDTFGPEAGAMLAPVGDVEALAERIAALASDPERVARLQRRAVARTREIHPRDVQRDAYLALLDRVTAGVAR